MRLGIIFNIKPKLIKGQTSENNYFTVIPDLISINVLNSNDVCGIGMDFNVSKCFRKYLFDWSYIILIKAMMMLIIPLMKHMIIIKSLKLML